MQNKIYLWNSEFEIGNWNKYANGYKQASLFLLKKYQDSEDRYLHEYLSIPIFFLFRHFTELQLKELIISYSKLGNKSAKAPTIHNLIRLWNDVKNIINELFFDPAGDLLKNTTNVTPEDVVKIEQHIKKLDLIDKQSTSFRYPIDKKGSNSIINDTEFEVDELRIEIVETFNFLSFVSFMIILFKRKKDKNNSA